MKENRMHNIRLETTLIPKSRIRGKEKNKPLGLFYQDWYSIDLQTLEIHSTD